MAADSPPARPPGRPKDITLDTAILAAAERHLGERGYAGMTIQGVAAAAGTSAPSLRRRYRDKLALALAGIDAMQTQPLPEKTADPRAGALAILNNLRVTMIRRNGLAILANIFAERARHPELLAHFRQRVEEPLRERLRQALSAGVETGQLPTSLDLDTAVSMLTGSLYAHYLNSQQLPEDWAEHTLHIVWPARPIAARLLIRTRPLGIHRARWQEKVYWICDERPWRGGPPRLRRCARSDAHGQAA